jgi:DNA-binding NarL/FixJ family response regulator
VVVADDHSIVAEGVRRLLAPHAEVVEVVADGRALVEAAARHKPDAAVVDVSMAGLNGIEAAARLSQLDPPPAILFLSMHADGATLAEALRAGALCLSR